MNRILAALAGGLALVLIQVPAQAGEITVGSSTGIQAVLKVLGPRFEKATGNTLNITYDTSIAIKGQIDGGKAFDVVILTPTLIADLSKGGKVVLGSGTDIAHAGIGLAVKKGAPRPHIANAADLKRALMSAKSIAYTTTGQSSIAFFKLTDQFGISDQIKAKGKTIPGGPTAQLVADGQADMAIQLIPELKAIPGVTVVPFPKELQSYVVLTGGVSTTAHDPKAAAALIQYLTSPKALPTIKAKGMLPGGV
jgi:molybdate transport system substrate-binding protein